MTIDAALKTQDTSFAIDDFLAAEAAKSLLRFSTAGSVDDGKSTLIGRLLYDSRNVYEDQVRAVTGKVVGLEKPAIDFALLTDGLRAEREQGITIDVAYRYFSTQRRKFIIADTPGHEQYTRNMATGASTADLAIILIDARKGILTQSRRHAYIASLLGTRHLVAAINKMDLVDFSEEVYRTLTTQLHALVAQVGGSDLVTIPVSALLGDNVVDRSRNMAWYAGPTLLEHLERVPVRTELAAAPFRMAVQRVIRPNQDYRGFAGQIASGTIQAGDRIMTLPSGHSSRIVAITTYDGDLAQASAPMSIALTLEDELDISRGDLLTAPDAQPTQASSLEASVVWFDAERLDTIKPYLLKHGASTRTARITRVLDRTNIQTLVAEPVSTLGMNDIGNVELELTLPLAFDAYRDNRGTGAFILIDPQSNATVAAGMIRGAVAHEAAQTQRAGSLVLALARADEVERRLIASGSQVVRTRLVEPAMLRALVLLGLTVLLEAAPTQQTIEALAGDGIIVQAAGEDHDA